MVLLKGLRAIVVDSAVAVAVGSVVVVGEEFVTDGVGVERVGWEVTVEGEELEAADIVGPVMADVVGLTVMISVLVCVTMMPPWPP